MKPHKGAFVNSATGYGKRHNNKSHKSSANNSSRFTESPKSLSSGGNKKCKHAEQEAEKPKLDDDTELNSGFGNYLRSNEGVEMMKMFVFANTVMVIVTMAWPHFKEQYIWFMEWWDSLKEQ